MTQIESIIYLKFSYMTESIVLGLVQGIAEWLPVSSEGMLLLTRQAFFNVLDFEYLITQALVLHLGTFFAALVYFWKDVVKVVQALFVYKRSEPEQQKLVKFLSITTIISGVVGIGLLMSVKEFFEASSGADKSITLLVGVLLLITAWLQFKAKDSGTRRIKDITMSDSIILGIVQGFATLPGLSRSGLTVATLLLKQFGKEVALKLSFLMSLPLVLGGNIILNISDFVWSQETVVAVVVAFVSGLATIHLLLKLAKKINFGYFVLLFAILTLLSVFV